MKPDPLVVKLKAEVEKSKDKLVIIAGTGVSITACRDQLVDGHKVAGWDGLLLHGVDYCQNVEHVLTAGEAEVLRMQIKQGTPDFLAGAAELVTSRLSRKAPASYRRWLKDTVGKLELDEPEILRVLGAFPGVLATLNYDPLFEKALVRQPVTWLDVDKDKLEEVLRGICKDAVLHLHGYYEVPESVVLGLRSYEKVASGPHTLSVLRLLTMDRTLMFVGCRGTVTDPNFSRLVEWAQEARAHATHRHFVLCRDGEAEAMRVELRSAPWLDVVPYGKDFEHLVPFLKSLLPKGVARPLRARATSKPRTPKSALPAPAVAAYLKRLAEETRFLRMIGLGENLQIDLEIKDAYVPLRAVVARSLTGKHLGRYSKLELDAGGHAEETQLSEMFTLAKRFKKRGVILLGEPGAGKTTGARQLCWLLASGEQTPAGLGLPRGLVPVFLRLRNLRDADAKKCLKDFVVRETQDDDAPEAEANPGPHLWNRQPPTLWVFDGLDEVVSEPVRVKVCLRIQEFLRHRTRDHVLVTSRYQGYGHAVDLGAGFVQFHVQPLKPEQVEAFVDRWFHAAYQELYGDIPKATKEADADAANLKRILNQEAFIIGGLKELRTNPLLLTVVCLVYHQEHALPRGRAALYDKCVTVLLESWRKGLYEQRPAQPFDPRAAQRVLAQLAWWMHCQSEDQAEGKLEREEDRRGSPSAPNQDMAKVVASTLAETAPGAGLGRDGRRFIERMRDESGILVTARPECCSFLHLTFQEYLAAMHAVEEGLACELVARAGKSWWREPILLALARASGPFAKQFFAALLDSPAWEADLSFTARCLDETAVLVFDPFLKQLKDPKAPDAQKVRILQLLREKDDSALLEVCGTLAGSENAELASAAREILARAKAPGVVEVVEKGLAEVAAAAKPGEVHVDPRAGIAFVVIPAGEFDMGAAKSQWDNERPVHRVGISKPFLLGKYSVTNREYQRFLEANSAIEPPQYWSNSQFNEPQQPVVGVSWEDAQVFCQWAGCRLPTEAEWEYACRAGNPGAYCFGDDESELEQYAWCGKNSGGKTQPVGQKKPNKWGLYDMHGNVWEWCQDWFASDYYKQSPKVDPTGPEKGDSRVLRGGSWYVDPTSLRSAYRLGLAPDPRNYNIGFRCVWVGGSSP